MSNQKLPVTIIRIDPEKKTIAAMNLLLGAKSNDWGVRRILKLDSKARIGQHELMRMPGGATLLAIGRMDIDQDMDAWRMPGTEQTAGISLLCGLGPNGGMVHVPVNTEWVRQRIQWCRFTIEAEDRGE